MTNEVHEDLPWMISSSIFLVDKNGKIVASFRPFGMCEMADLQGNFLDGCKNAKRAALAVNNHTQLVTALRNLLKHQELDEVSRPYHYSACKQAEKVLAVLDFEKDKLGD